MHASADESGKYPLDAARCSVTRWLVSFASGGGWYPVGEFIAADATAAIERAIEVLGSGAGYQAEVIPWGAAPFSMTDRSVVRD